MKAANVNKLIALCNATSKHYENAVYLTAEPALKEMLIEGIMINATAVIQLKTYLRSERLEIQPKKNYLALLHRIIMIARTAINSNPNSVLIEECGKADKRVIKAFENVWLRCKDCDTLKDLLLSHINTVDLKTKAFTDSFAAANVSQELA